VEQSVATLLEGEGVLIDPVGAILAVVVLETIFKANVPVEADIVEILLGLVLRLGTGLGVGVLGGWLLSLFLKWADFLSEEISNLLVLACVAMGIVLNSSAIPEERLLRRFKGKLTILCVSVLFILLAADLSLASIVALGWGSVLTVLTLMLVVRPLSVWLCTFSSSLSWQQKCFVAWIAPRGIVSASVASLFAILLTERGINGGDAIKALVFLTIMMTVFLQGLTAKALALALGITSARTTGAVIIGCTPLGRLIASLFQSQGESVVLIDTDLEACQAAKDQDLPVFHSSGLDPNILEEAGINSMGTFLALTSNGEVNLVLAQHAQEEFNPPRVLVVMPTPLPETQSSLKNHKGMQIFIDQQRFKTWNQYIKDDQVQLGRLNFSETDLAQQQARIQGLIEGGELLPLMMRRNGNLQLIKNTETWAAGDEMFYLLHDPRPALLKRLSGGRAVSRLALANLPAVEEMPLLPDKALEP
jgi:Trk K+ transport system NAD-binding subunit